MYRLHTNESGNSGVLVRQEPTREQMWRYIRAKRALGIPLSDIMFCWGPERIIHNVENIVKNEEIKAETRKVKE